MAGKNLRTTDWEHRLHVLWAWRICRRYATSGDRDEGATYRAVLDGCAITVRALCSIIGVGCSFKDKPLSNGQNRTQELLGCCNFRKKIRDVSWKFFTLATAPWLILKMDKGLTTKLVNTR
jgi:hypothetical protein